MNRENSQEDENLSFVPRNASYYRRQLIKSNKEKEELQLQVYRLVGYLDLVCKQQSLEEALRVAGQGILQHKEQLTNEDPS